MLVLSELEINQGVTILDKSQEELTKTLQHPSTTEVSC